jgi:alcohol dehydrogenase class IV
LPTTIQEYISAWTSGVRPFIDGRRVFVILDPAVEASFGIIAKLTSLGSARSVTPFTDFSPNPSWNSLGAIMKVARYANAECVLAIGGGTAIDLAKLLATALQMGGIDQLWTATEAGHEVNFTRSNIGLMAIPTTAGTGAEVTRFAVLYREGIKHSLSGDALKPDTSILDPSLLASLPKSVMADAGLDAVCQAMESLWSVRSTPESELNAHAAIVLAIEHLESAIHSPRDVSMAGMLVAAHLAGRAINLTTTTAPHALSYGLTSLFGIPHGRAVAFLFAPVFRKNASMSSRECQHPGGPEFVSQRLQEIANLWGRTSQEFPSFWNNYLYEKLQIPHLDSSISPLQLDQLCESVNANRLENNPRAFSAHEIRDVYHGLVDANS